MKHSTLQILCLLSISVWTPCLGAYEKSAEAWIESIKTEAQNEKTTPAFESIRIGAGMCIGSHPGKQHRSKRYEKKYQEYIDSFKQFMKQEGESLLEKWLKGEELSQAERKYWYILQGIYFNRAYTKKTKDQTRYYVYPAQKTDFTHAKHYQETIYNKGVTVLQKYYRGEHTLSVDDIEILRLFRILQGVRGTGEWYLPFHLGLHPSDPSGKPAGHRRSQPYLSLVGYPAPDIKAPFLETVLKRKVYQDEVDYPYYFSLALRPEGVLHFLEPLTFYAMKEENVCTLKPELLELKKGEKSEHFFRMSKEIVDKPMVFIVNAPRDSAFSAFPYLETLYQAYGDKVNFCFAGTDLHDWFLNGENDYYTPNHRNGPEHRLLQTHSYSQEEIARELKNRFIEFPEATFPCIVDDMGYTIKNTYWNFGGQNHINLIDKKGTIVYRGSSAMVLQINWLEHLEAAIQTYLNPKSVAFGTKSNQKNPEIFDLVMQKGQPKEKYLSLFRASIASIDLAQGTLVIKSGNSEYSATVNKWTRLSERGKTIGLDQFKSGDAVNILFSSTDYYQGNYQAEPTKKSSFEHTAYKISSNAGIGEVNNKHSMRLPPYDREICEIVTDTGNKNITLLQLDKTQRSTFSAATIFYCGYVQEIHNDGREIIVQQKLSGPEKMKGYHFAQQDAAKIKLDTITKEKMAVLDFWHARPPTARVDTFVIDDAVGIFINGHMHDVSRKDIKTGDFVAIEIYTEQAQEKRIYPNMVRVSRTW